MRHTTAAIYGGKHRLSGPKASGLALILLWATATGCVRSNEELMEYNCSDSSCENSTVVCQPNERLGCDPQGNARWYDSCSQPGAIFKECDDNATCAPTGETYDCICHPSWYGDGESCLPCTCQNGDPCCSNGCTLDAEHSSCSDTDPQTIEESCTAFGQCVGTDYCDAHSCSEVIHTGQDLCYTGTPGPGEPCAFIDACPQAHGEQADYCGQDGHYQPLLRQNQLTVISLASDTDSDTDSDSDTRDDAAILDPHTGLVWSFEAGESYERFTHTTATLRCNTLTWGGLTWRLPTIREWIDVVNFQDDTLATHDVFAVEPYSNLYPSLSEHVAGVGHWHVQLAAHETPVDWGTVLGIIGFHYSPVYDNVRCVSGVPQSIAGVSERFAPLLVNLDTTVLDRATGLEWTQYRWLNATWQEALAYCEALDHGGRQDWKLPDVNELRSLLDFTQAQPASLFPFDEGDDLTEGCWSSTSSSGRPEHAWAVRFEAAGMETRNKEDRISVRCARR